MAMDNKGWFSNETATFGDRLAGARDAAGLTQEEMARRLGVRLKTLQSWEDDLAEPRANRLQMMAGMLNVSLRWLLTGEGDGVEGPSEPAVLPAEGREALSELARMRTQMLALAQEMGQLEKRMRALLRKEAE
ncbi:helix-turn-helix domain-containing protein [Rhodobacter sp. NSM]|uniref:helix-turn-helix domain-containing protein n=1 Tax=Rhodobacter sp. NSM TaxID=3457501 RepID=UPI003FD3F80A